MTRFRQQRQGLKLRQAVRIISGSIALQEAFTRRFNAGTDDGQPSPEPWTTMDHMLYSMGFRSGEFGGHCPGVKNSLFHCLKSPKFSWLCVRGLYPAGKKGAGQDSEPLEAATRRIHGIKVSFKASI